MRAIVVHAFGEPEVLRLETVPDPKPGAGQVLVKLAAAGVNPVETYIRSGQYANARALPYTPGEDGAGTVVAYGDEPAGAEPAPGARVYLSGSLTGTYAEYAVCTADQIHPLSDAMSFPQGAALGVPYATAYRALFQRAGARRGETVLVHGASGAVGVAATQFAVAAGLTVLATAGSEAGRRLAAAQGAAHVLDHTDPSYADQLLELTGGRGVDVIIEMAAHANLGRDPGLLAYGGRVVVIGSRGPHEVNARDLMARDAQIMGMLLMIAPPDALAAAHAAIGEGLRSGALRPVIEEEIPLAEAARAHHAVLEHKAAGKIVLVP